MNMTMGWTANAICTYDTYTLSGSPLPHAMQQPIMAHTNMRMTDLCKDHCYAASARCFWCHSSAKSAVPIAAVTCTAREGPVNLASQIA